MIPLSTTSAAMLMVNGGTALRRRLRRSLEDNGYHVIETSSEGRAVSAALPSRGAPSKFGGSSVLQRLRGKKPVSLMIVSERPGSSMPITAPGDTTPETNNAANQVFHYGPLSIDFDNRLVKIEGRRVRLTVTEYAVLRLLIERIGKVVPHSEIVRKIWGCSLARKISCLRVYACSLREKLRSPTLPTLLVTEPGVGYRLAFPE